MTQLPKTGDKNWADVLNGFLLTEHRPDGTLKLRDDGTVELTKHKGKKSGYAPLNDKSQLPVEFLPVDTSAAKPGDAIVFSSLHPMTLTTATTTDDCMLRVDPTGTPDDAANIQAALDTLAAAGGGVVELCVGTYLFPAPATSSLGGVRISDNCRLIGKGMGATILKYADSQNADSSGIVRTVSGTANKNIYVADLTIDGNKANNTGTVIGVYTGVTPNNTATDLDIMFERVEAKNCSDYGFDPHERTTRLLLVDCISHDNTIDGFTLDGCYDTKVVNCISYNNGRHGFNLVTASNHVELIGCQSYGNTSNGITFQQGTKHSAITGGQVHDNTAVGIYINGTAQGSGQDTTPGADNTITGVMIEKNGTHGIQVRSSSYNHIVDNTLRDNSQTTNNASAQIVLDDASSIYSTYNRVSNNDMRATATNKPKYGLREGSSNDDFNFYLGNSSTGAVTAQLSLQGATSLSLAAHNGVNEHPAVTPYATDSPAGHTYIEWNYDPISAGSGSGVAGTAGVMNFAKLTRGTSGALNNVIMVVGTAGATLSNCYVGVYDASGTLLATSADCSTALSSTGVKSIALGSAISPASGATLFVTLLTNGTTLPAVVRSGSTGGSIINAGLSASTAHPYRFGTVGSSLTALPGTFDVTTSSSSSLSFWCALS